MPKKFTYLSFHTKTKAHLLLYNTMAFFKDPRFQEPLSAEESLFIRLLNTNVRFLIYTHVISSNIWTYDILEPRNNTAHSLTVRKWRIVISRKLSKDLLPRHQSGYFSYVSDWASWPGVLTTRHLAAPTARYEQRLPAGIVTKPPGWRKTTTTSIIQQPLRNITSDAPLLSLSLLKPLGTGTVSATKTRLRSKIWW